MKKKLLILFLAVITCFACVTGIVGCKGGKDNGDEQGTVQPPPENQDIAVEKVTLNKNELILEIGASETLTATVAPANATVKTVTWKSSDTSVAKVVNGLVFALKKGVSTITATAGVKSATCTVTVTENIIAHKHSLTPVPAKQADCEEAGNKAYYTCTCGKWFSDADAKTEIIDKSSVTIKATGHSYSEEWTYNETQHWRKATCKHTSETTVPQNHTFVNNACSVCEYTKKTQGLIYTAYRTGYAVTGYNGTATKVTVPSKHDGKSVLAIGMGTGDGFAFCSNVTEIILPDTIQQIQAEAFSYCAKLRKITISSCLSVGNRAFANCAALTEITLPENCLTYGNNLFENCNSLKKVNIKSGVIGDFVFNGCSSVTDIEFGSGVTSISKKIFDNCTNLINLSIPNIDCIDFKFGELGSGSLKKITVTEQQLSLKDERLVGAPCEVVVLNRFPVNGIQVVGATAVCIYDFNFNDYYLKVTRTSGEEVRLTLEEHISQAAKDKLNTTGKHTVAVTVEGFSIEWEIEILNYEFENIIFESQSFFYDGTAKSLQVTGAPEGTEITYSGNDKTKIGEYTVTATLKKQYYNTKTLTATLTVKKSEYNVKYNLDIDGATNANPETYNALNGLTLVAPERGGWEFLGWYTDSAKKNKKLSK